MKVYLAGPILGCSDAECKDWRAYCRANLRHEVIDPMRRDYRGRELEAARELVEADKEDIDAADALLVYYSRPSVGTSMEVLYAWERGKRVVVIIVRAANPPLSPWLFYHATDVCNSLSEAVEKLNAAG